MPIGSIRNVNHPSTLVIAGNHNDEYEGQVTLPHLERSLEADDISGHLLLLHMSNYSAARVGRRALLIDEGNLNRNFAVIPVAP